MALQKTAYSYVRFSREHQGGGDSLRRQVESTKRYCEKRGLVLDDSLALRDLGVSAFKGANVGSGALGRFLQAVESGTVPRGSALVVEGLDRLSRQDPWKTISLLKQLKDGGIEIHLTMADIILSPDEPDDGMKLMYAVITAIRAHDESKTKSRRLVAAFAAKRGRALKGELVSKSVPWWLEVRQGKIAAVPERIKVVKRIFKLVVRGNSSSRIARQFNREKIPTWRPKADRWVSSRIRDLVRGDAVLGVLNQTSKTTKAGRSHPAIANYYPKIVSPSVVAEARAAMQGNRLASVGRVASGEKPLNIFRGLLRHKGRWMRYQPHRNGKRDPETGLKGYNGHYDVVDPDSGKNEPWSISAKQLEPVLVGGLRELKVEDFYPSKNSGVRRSDSIRAVIRELEKRHCNLLDAVELGSKAASVRLVALENQLEAKQGLLADTEAFEARHVGPREIELSKIPHDLVDNQLRKRTALAIKNVVKRIDIGRSREELPWTNELLLKLTAKAKGESLGRLPHGYEKSSCFVDPIPKSKLRKPLWILVTFLTGTQRLIARTSSGVNEIANVRIERSSVELADDFPLIA